MQFGVLGGGVLGFFWGAGIFRTPPVRPTGSLGCCCSSRRCTVLYQQGTAASSTPAPRTLYCALGVWGLARRWLQGVGGASDDRRSPRRCEVPLCFSGRPELCPCTTRRCEVLLFFSERPDLCPCRCIEGCGPGLRAMFLFSSLLNTVPREDSGPS